MERPTAAMLSRLPQPNYPPPPSTSRLQPPLTLPGPGAGMNASMGLGGGRMSMAPRQSMAPPGTLPRNQRSGATSMARSAVNNPLLASASRPTPYGQTPSMRRVSHFPGRPTSSLITAGSHSIKEPRQIRSKGLQRKMQDDILAYLNDNHCTLGVNMKTLQSPTTKDFQNLFKWLFNHVFAHEFVFGRGKESFEEELIGLMKLVRYPLADTISKNALAAVGGMTTWPGMLAMLHWMVEIDLIKLNWLESDDIYVMPEDRLPAVWPEELNGRICMDYIADTYAPFLNGADEFPDADQALEDRFQKRDEAILKEMEELEAEIKQLNQENAKLSAQSPLEETQEKIRNLEAELEKVDDSLKRQNIKKDKAEMENIQFEEAIHDYENRILELRALAEKLTQQIREQNLSPEEVEKMNTDKDTLARTLEDLRIRQDDAEKFNRKKEVEIARKVNGVGGADGGVEGLVNDYETAMIDAGVYPHGPKDMVFPDSLFAVQFHPAASDHMAMLGSTQDLTKIREGLHAIAEHTKKERQRVEADFDRIHNDVILQDEACNDNSQWNNDTSKEVESLLMNAEKEREKLDDIDKAAAKAKETLENLVSARMTSQQSGLEVQSQLESSRIKLSETVDRVTKFRERTIKTIVQHSEDICEFKRVTAAKLEELAEFAREA